MFQFDVRISGSGGHRLKCERGPLGSARSLRAVFGSLPNTSFVGKLPTNAGWQPALPGTRMLFTSEIASEF